MFFFILRFLSNEFHSLFLTLFLEYKIICVIYLYFIDFKYISYVESLFIIGIKFLILDGHNGISSFWLKTFTHFTDTIFYFSEGGDLLERVLRIPLSYVDESESASEAESVPGSVGVRVRLAPGSDGLFGFNVRGGGGAPVLVSRVASRTKLHLQEGDQVGVTVRMCVLFNCQLWKKFPWDHVM